MRIKNFVLLCKKSRMDRSQKCQNVTQIINRFLPEVCKLLALFCVFLRQRGNLVLGERNHLIFQCIVFWQETFAHFVACELLYFCTQIGDALSSPIFFLLQECQQFSMKLATSGIFWQMSWPFFYLVKWRPSCIIYSQINILLARQQP